MTWEEQLTGWNFGLSREIKRLIAQQAVDIVKRFGIEPDSYAWRCWWETQ